MSYNPLSDFLALLRSTSGGEELSRMPGLDYVVAALSRAGILNVSIGQTAPAVNQPTTAWFKPAVPTWTAEGVLFLWDAVSGTYKVANPLLWAAFSSSGGPGYAFQSATNTSNIINVGVSLLAVQRTSPTATSLLLPNLINQWQSGRRLQIVDFSTGVANHVITIATPDSSTIMQGANWTLLSTADQLAGIMLQPSPDLNAWIIAP